MQDTHNFELKNKPIHNYLSDEDIFKVYGYKVFRHPNFKSFLILKEDFNEEIKCRLEKFSKQKLNNFHIKEYHDFVMKKNIDHHKFIGETKRNLNSDWLSSQVYLKILKEMAEDHFKKKLKFFEDRIEFRVVRPNFEDNNPLHRDHWFGYFTPLINIYIPIAGSWNDSAMTICPKSHLWPENSVKPTFKAGEKKTIKNGIAYSVPDIAHSDFAIDPHRPDVLEGDFMLFSPLLVHGGGTNHSHETRFSFEIRLEVTE